ncbi:hypothetical protein QJU11_09910 [Pasteurella atlantica]|uniref:hypothetical protein n=1 Tax=Phocoenobacter atlanticus TaxID=3416742 RepID=UPI00275AB272|nr:hypothetical protein [Pasteurella atlantica]MDP8042505.1 hypothetical protein [Pasteurella atlantica]
MKKSTKIIINAFIKTTHSSYEIWVDDEKNCNEYEETLDLINNILPTDDGDYILLYDFLNNLIQNNIINILPLNLGVFFKKAEMKEGKTVWLPFSTIKF